MAIDTQSLEQLTWERLQSDFVNRIKTMYAIEDGRLYRRVESRPDRVLYSVAPLIESDDDDEFAGVDTIASTLPRHGKWRSLSDDPRPLVEVDEYSHHRYDVYHVDEGSCDDGVGREQVVDLIREGCRVVLISSELLERQTPVELTEDSI